jgi:hypothetical protein
VVVSVSPSKAALATAAVTERSAAFSTLAVAVALLFDGSGSLRLATDAVFEITVPARTVGATSSRTAKVAVCPGSSRATGHERVDAARVQPGAETTDVPLGSGSVTTVPRPGVRDGERVVEWLAGVRDARANPLVEVEITAVRLRRTEAERADSGLGRGHHALDDDHVARLPIGDERGGQRPPFGISPPASSGTRRRPRRACLR